MRAVPQTWSVNLQILKAIPYCNCILTNSIGNVESENGNIMKFIHIADVHLGACPDLGFPWSKTREKEIWESFSKIIEKIKSEKTDLLLIAGDLFHGQPLVRELKELNYLFGQIPNTKVVLIAGNHDYLKADSAYKKISWEPNVIGLWSDSCQACYLKSCNTYVYGFSYTTRELREMRYNQAFPGGSQNFAQDHPDANHILLAHGGDEKHVPIQLSSLAEADFDYIALGHIHQPQILIPNKMAYAGSLEPLSRTHLGMRGYIEGEIVNGITKIQFVPFAKRQYVEMVVPVTPSSTVGSIQDEITTFIEENGRQHIYCIHLEGLRDAELILEEEAFVGLGNIVEVTDETKPDYDFNELRKKYAGTLVATYIESFLVHEELTEVEQKALYYGVGALLHAGE